MREGTGAEAASEWVQTGTRVRSPEDNEKRMVSEVQTGNNGAPQTAKEVAPMGN